MQTMDEPRIIEASYLDKAMSYKAYRERIDGLLAQNKTTGNDHSDDMLEYSRMNVVRMKRLDKTTHILPEVAAVLTANVRPITVLCIAEAWCGDASQIVPVVAHLAALSETIDYKVVLRDENTELMDAFLTNGTRSIPIFIFVDTASHKILGHWGPRPALAQEMVVNFKKNPIPGEEIKTVIHKWYADNKTVAIQEEFLAAWQRFVLVQ
jgi:hypothetical protein